MDKSTGRSAMCIRLFVEAGEKTRDQAAQQGETGSDVEQIQRASQQDILTKKCPSKNTSWPFSLMLTLTIFCVT